VTFDWENLTRIADSTLKKVDDLFEIVFFLNKLYGMTVIKGINALIVPHGGTDNFNAYRVVNEELTELFEKLKPESFK
jgi:hypothetical protein